MRIFDDVDRRGRGGQRRGIHQGGQPTPACIRIDARRLSLGIGDTEQILVERDVLGIGVGKGPGLDQCAGGSRVDTFDAGRRTHQSSDDVERHLGGVRFAERGEYIARRGDSPSRQPHV